MRRRSGSTRRRVTSNDQPKTGAASPGETFDPMAVPEDASLTKLQGTLQASALLRAGAAHYAALDSAGRNRWERL